MNQPTLTPEELDALCLGCENKPLTILEQGIKHGQRYTVAASPDGELFLTLVTRSDGLVDVSRAQQTTIEDALADAYDSAEPGVPSSERWCALDAANQTIPDEEFLGTPDERDRILTAAGLAAGVGENPDETDDPLGHLPALDELE